MSSHQAPPFSPVLLAGLLLRPMPLVVVKRALNTAFSAILKRHPGMFERLKGVPGAVFLIDPVDLPWAFLLDAHCQHPGLTVVSRGDAGGSIATIRGPLMVLLQLLEGNSDGDALFFARELEIEGDTGAVVALRNALDGMEIDILEDFASAFGPLSGVARRASHLGAGLFAQARADLALVQGAVLAPLQRRLDGYGTTASLRGGEAKPERTPQPRNRRAPLNKRTQKAPQE